MDDRKKEYILLLSQALAQQCCAKAAFENLIKDNLFQKMTAFQQGTKLAREDKFTAKFLIMFVTNAVVKYPSLIQQYLAISQQAVQLYKRTHVAELNRSVALNVVAPIAVLAGLVIGGAFFAAFPVAPLIGMALGFLLCCALTRLSQGKERAKLAQLKVPQLAVGTPVSQIETGKGGTVAAAYPYAQVVATTDSPFAAKREQPFTVTSMPSTSA